jgi:hypothetical protein
MDHYLFTARSVTHAQRMAQELARGGVGATLRRAGNTLTKSGCGYTLQVSERQFRRAAELLRAGGLRPVRTLHVVNDTPYEVAT